MEDIKEGLRQLVEEKNAAILVTVVAVKGSTPRKPGAKMLLFPDGRVFGTVGGGCGEAEIRREALNVFDSKVSQTFTLNMTNDTAADEGMVCGGIMEVFIEFLDGSDAEFWQACLNVMSAGENFKVATVVKSDGHVLNRQRVVLSSSGRLTGNFGQGKLDIITETLLNSQDTKTGMYCFDKFGQPCAREDAVNEIFVENVIAPIELLILGGGHIALPVCEMAKILGYKVTVVDDRPLFANHKRFAAADRVICNSFAQALSGLSINPATYIVIVTRGHKHDKECLQTVIDKPAGYIGMIGSKRRVKALLTELAENGTEQERLDRVFSPIGLNIGAETPAEIAVSILAEIIQVQRAGLMKSGKSYRQGQILSLS